MYSRVITTLIMAFSFLSYMTDTEAKNLKVTYAAIGGVTSVPYGWIDFCNRRPEECNVSALPAMDINLNAQAMSELNRINAQVNAYIQPVSNLEHWGTILDHWDYPTDGKGDCKIYALYKRKLLIDEGFPRQALLMTVVKEANGEGHAILTVKTDQGDFALDNLDDAVKPWNKTPYRLVKRQSETNQNVWVALGAPTAAPAYVSK